VGERSTIAAENASGARHDVGPEDRQVVVGIGEPDAVEDLQSVAESRDLQMKLAKSDAAKKLVADR
jgi:hypothetical protein